MEVLIASVVICISIKTNKVWFYFHGMWKIRINMKARIKVAAFVLEFSE